jgi:hypothetical protein
MENGILDRLTGIADTSLLARVKTLVGGEREVVAELIAHLAEMDIREIHLREGYPSLYVYLPRRPGPFRVGGLPPHRRRAYRAAVSRDPGHVGRGLGQPHGDTASRGRT